MLDLLQDLQNLLNLKDLKTVLGNRSWNELPGVLKDIRKAYQDAMDQQQQLQDEHRTLQIKYLDLNERFTNLQTQTQTRSRATNEPDPPTLDETPNTQTKQNPTEKIHIPDPPIFQNDGNPTWGHGIPT